MSTQHTPGPWFYHTGTESVRADTMRLIVSMPPEPCETAEAYTTLQANARRIASCVNACEGINPDAVQELLKNLIIATNYLERVDGGNEHTKRQIEHLRKLIAKATTI